MTLSLGIDAIEKRFIAVTDIKGAYLHTFMDKFCVNGPQGPYQNASPSVPQIQKFLHITKKGKKLLYVCLKQALSGCIKLALLWWTMLSEFLIADGFKLNPYNSCVPNKALTCGKQITICWYMDNLKISLVN
jgi:hypothetical protein